MTIKTLPALYEDLEKYRNFDENPENAELFLNTVDAIVMQKEISSIPILLKYFDDKSEYSWILETLGGAIECYDEEDYVITLIRSSHTMLPKAIEWLSSLMFHIMNSEKHLTIFRHNMHLADKDSLLKLFDVMEEESPHHQALITELRKELEGKL